MSASQYRGHGMRFFRRGAAVGVCATVALWWAAIAPAAAQMPVAVPPSPEAAEIATCLCLQQSLPVLEARMAETRRLYDVSLQEVASLDAQLQSARTTLDVYNPEAVAQFRQLLHRRDDAFRQSSGPLFSQYSNTVGLFNERANEFNARCAGRTRNPVLVNQVQATLVCPPVL